MFEAVITICLLAAPDVCRDQLLPGYEAATESACLTALESRPPAQTVPPAAEVRGVPRCLPPGPILEMIEVAPGVFVHMGQIAEPDRANFGDVSNLGFILGETSVAVIDTGSARWVGEALWRAIREETDLPVSHVILTHMHPDHVLGAAAFETTGAQVVGHAQLARALADRQANYIESLDRLIGPDAMLGTRSVAVDLEVAQSLELDLGGRVLELEAWPLAHTGTDLTVFDTETRTLFAGDLVFHLHIPALDGSLRGWRAVMAEMESRDVQRVVPGHGGPTLDWPAGGAAQARYLQILERDARAAIEAGQRLGDAAETIGRSEAGAWQLFDAFNARNATVAFTELEWE